MIKEFVNIYKKVDGTKVLKQYHKAGVLFYALFHTMSLGFSQKSLEIVRLAIQNKIKSKLKRKYAYVAKEFKENEKKLIHQQSNKVWVCWLQGIENAPLIVKRCYDSLQKYLKDKEIILITEDNYRDYVEFPGFILEKYKKGIISKTHFSDLLRLELLIKYGGTWIDATVLCTGNDMPDYILNSDLFVYQMLKPGKNGHSITISSWLMTACTNNNILMLTRKFLYEYWSKNNTMVDYFLLHMFFCIACEYYPEEQKKIPKVCNSIPHILLLELFDDYNEEFFNHVKKMTCFHKLNYKFDEAAFSKKGTYFDVVVRNRKY